MSQRRVSQHRVLIVEDDRAIRDSMTEILADEGYTVDQAANGREALERLRADGGIPCLILLDLMMPVMDGFEFRAHQIDDPRLAAIPVVVLTADGHAEEKARRLSAVAVIKKPLLLQDLVATVRKLCP